MQKHREFLVRDAFTLNAFQEVGRHQHDADLGLREPFVDFTDEGHSQLDVFLAEPDFHATLVKQVVQLLR
ncbi:hypothetical protein D3C87_2070590 [compost metagenome]